MWLRFSVSRMSVAVNSFSPQQLSVILQPERKDGLLIKYLSVCSIQNFAAVWGVIIACQVSTVTFSKLLIFHCVSFSLKKYQVFQFFFWSAFPGSFDGTLALHEHSKLWRSHIRRHSQRRIVIKVSRPLLGQVPRVPSLNQENRSPSPAYSPQNQIQNH